MSCGMTLNNHLKTNLMLIELGFRLKQTIKMMGNGQNTLPITGQEYTTESV
ncbi:hypothetical protein [Caudoviricetes sp.]|nr:hypothetical protein [Caudoviricetes sp.]